MFRKLLPLVLALLLLCGCGSAPSASVVQLPETLPPETTPPETTVPLETLLPITLPPKTQEHTPLFDPDYPTEDVIRYFAEVCLDAEIINSGDPSLLQKWADPISYRVFGSPTQEDSAILENFVRWLNTIDGFPDMAEAAESQPINFRIYFCTQEEMLNLMGEEFDAMDGAVTFWYDRDQIYDAIVCIRTDLDQHLRNSVILEELYNSLGPIQDTSLREDSIIYSGYSEPQALTPMDELLLKLLYHPTLRCGMTKEECDAAIRALYH